MNRSGLGSFLHHLRGVLGPPGAADRTDGELLGAYCSHKDQAAFATIVQRHGPMVLMVCGRVLERAQDREDVFQATFLALARDANAVRKRESLASWLHGVARHIALDARRAAVRRHKHEGAAMTTTPKSPAWEAAWREVQVVLDEEIQRLPPRYREPFVLCCLESLSRTDAARRLGVKEGTVGSRLTEARRRLSQRLARRGVELGAVLGALAVASRASARVPTPLVGSVTNTALQMASGQALPAGLVSAPVLSLVQRVPKAMFLTKKMIGIFVLLAVGIVGTGVGALAQRQTDRVIEARPADYPRGADDSPLSRRAAGVDNLAPWRRDTLIVTEDWLPGSVAFAPDGKTLIVGGSGGRVAAFNLATNRRPWLTKIGGDFTAVAFAADGKSVLATFKDGVRFIDAATGQQGDALEEKDTNPVAVGVFPDKILQPGGQRQFTFHKIAFASSQRCYVKMWTDSGAPGTIEASTAGKNAPDPSAVPLAVDPEGRSMIVKGGMDRDSGNNVLWAWVAGDYEKGSPGNRVLKGHETAVVSAAWSGNGKLAVTGDASGRLILWDAKMMKEIRRRELGRRIAALALSPDGKHIAAIAIDKRAQFYIGETTDLKSLRRLVTDASDFSEPTHAGLAFSPDGQHLAGAAFSKAWLSRLGELRGKVHVWKHETSKSENGTK